MKSISNIKELPFGEDWSLIQEGTKYILVEVVNKTGIIYGRLSTSGPM